VSVTAISHPQGAHKFISVCSLCVNLCGRDSTYVIKILIQIIKIPGISLWLNTT